MPRTPISSFTFSRLRRPRRQYASRRSISHRPRLQTQPAAVDDAKQGAMSRRLAQATEDALLDGGRAGQQAIEAAGFSDELKAELLGKIAGQQFKSENLAAFTEAELSPAVGRGTRDIAIAAPWTGTEGQGDAVLRMLHDAHKPLQPMVDMRLQGAPKKTPGQRISNARERTSTYAASNDSNMTSKEREELRATLKERFGSGVQTGSMPTSFRGLESLANRRIEDAIARGQFKDIPRGTSAVRDSRVDNPFVDTTEYIMNNMIKRQALVPPWIEKQQALHTAAATFRARLRKDWTRHAVGMVAAAGGSVEEQVRRAEAYARAEKGGKRGVEVSSTTQASDQSDPREQAGVEAVSRAPEPLSPSPAVLPVDDMSTMQASDPSEPSPAAPPFENPPPLRDPAWERQQLPYLTLAIAELNATARAYNLQAPELAKKPYYALEREMASCFADVAGVLAGEVVGIRDEPDEGIVRNKERDRGVMWRIVGEKAVVRDERGPKYGFKELWRDIFR
ncbi:hypothetical protein V498_07019 [Pseudogymnoascus sp. VKM F-4517 (FW-2822)]|nr:hypothetical protein V498_07019 [Pseudogymnoascus sp. VKM F-4517 (FW-2822)]